MKKITARANPLIQKLKKLQDPKFRKKYFVCLVEGERTCIEFFRSSFELENLIITEKHIPFATQWASQEKIVLVSDHVMEYVSQASTPSGILAVFKIPQKDSVISDGIVLAQIQDPGNMGALIRTAVACNVPTIVIIEGCDPWSHKVIQSSAGTIAHANLIIISWNELLQKKGNLMLAALVVKNGIEIQKASHQNSLLVIGNEARGLPDTWLNECSTKITLPMPGGTESLNAAVAGSIAVYIAYVL